MALAGIGVDMLEIARMEAVMRRRPRFLTRVFTQEERDYCESRPHPAEHYAACFAAREAVAKALGTGFSNGVSFSNISVSYDSSGRPHAILSGGAAEMARKQGVREVALSLSCTHDVAVANAVAVTDEVRPRANEKPDPERELAETFREARSILDELDRAQEGIIEEVPAAQARPADSSEE
ncbi:MAG: holo-ACP synthase [Tractidigestivibacter sp.]|jgi:holo-[acyl-carrier protein] synthase|uniref:holo-ACP synthase n=1 Tax=Tractidigestivibacter sp. TaxID=2847320 RepID=UPI003D9090AE